MKNNKPIAGAEVHEQVKVVAIREIEGAIRGLENDRKTRRLTKGEKEVLRKLGPTIFLRGFLWTLDNIAMRDDPKVEELEEILLNIANGSQETVDVAYKAAVELAIKKGLAIKQEREDNERKLQEEKQGHSEGTVGPEALEEAAGETESQPAGGSGAGPVESGDQHSPEENVQGEDGRVEGDAAQPEGER